MAYTPRTLSAGSWRTDMRRSLATIATAAALLLGGAAQAVAGAGTYGKNDRAEWDPPAQYAGAYAGELVEHVLPQWRVPAACAALGAPWSATQRGCALVRGDTCTVVRMADRYGKATPDAVRRHELGHCNGWSSNHE
jgi:hypothetical protein